MPMSWEKLALGLASAALLLCTAGAARPVPQSAPGDGGVQLALPVRLPLPIGEVQSGDASFCFVMFTDQHMGVRM